MLHADQHMSVSFESSKPKNVKNYNQRLSASYQLIDVINI